MLGMDSKTTPVVSGAFANGVRDALKRAKQGQPNDFDRRVEEHSEQIKKEYEAIWK